MKILLSFIGNNDCYPEEKKGAILSILQQKKFDKLYLLYNHEKYLKPASKILLYCKEHFPYLKVHYQEALSENPTDYNTVYPAMYSAVKQILNENKNANYTISITSGTPTMHACWIFLKQGGVIDANLIQISKEAEISEVTFELDDFPKIQNVNEVKAELTKISRENINLKNQLHLKYDNIVGECPEILKIKEQIKMFSDTNIPIFIQGESGTGKELVAEAIHYNSSRKEKSFIKINCGAIPKELFESEFFGHKKGSFTGAISDKVGKFKLADGGTIFLDEITDLPIEMQVKLLRVLQDGTFIPLGSTQEVKVNVRIISATNKDIRELVSNGDFREDLFYRLNVIRLELPPLKERKGDIPLLIEHIMKRFYATREEIRAKRISKEAMEILLNYDYPGNIRELENILEHALILCQDEIIERKHLPIFLQKRFSPTGSTKRPTNDLTSIRHSSEKHRILETLKQYNWHRGKTAQELNIDRTTLWRKMKKYNLFPNSS